MFAADIWAHLLEADPFSPEAGRRIRRELLETGGTVEPDVILRRLLGLSVLRRGALGRVGLGLAGQKSLTGRGLGTV